MLNFYTYFMHACIYKLFNFMKVNCSKGFTPGKDKHSKRSVVSFVCPLCFFVWSLTWAEQSL